ncbi:MAG: DUF2569 domain-containing protein [Vulcanibacillus sp.]
MIKKYIIPFIFLTLGIILSQYYLPYISIYASVTIGCILGVIGFSLNDLLNRMKDSNTNKNSDLSKKTQDFGGWLYLVAIIFILNTSITINNTLNTLLPFFANENWKSTVSQKYHSMGRLIIYSELTIDITFIILLSLIIYTFIKRKKALRVLVISYFIINLLFTLYVYFKYAPVPPIYEYSLQGCITHFVWALIFCSILVPYFLFSKRVKNTYIY